VPLDEYNKTGAAGYVSSLVTGVPVAILRPMIGVSDGVTKTLMGVQKWVDPAQQKETNIKYKKRDSIGGGTREEKDETNKEQELEDETEERVKEKQESSDDDSEGEEARYV